jgi:4'-phosphopantetheinyl transferase EntD
VADGLAVMTIGKESDKLATAKRIADWLAACAPNETAVVVDRIGQSAAFDAEEERAIARAITRRRDEFTTGRRLAREALSRLGCVAVGIPPDPDRVPRWPDGFVGTISHSGGLCAALVARVSNFVGIGIDIEETTRFQPGLTSLICRPDETHCDETNGVVDLTLLRFVAKEAFFKAYFPAIRTFLDFQDVRVSVNPTRDRFEAQLMKPNSPSLYGSRAFDGRFAAFGTHVVAAVWIDR